MCIWITSVYCMFQCGPGNRCTCIPHTQTILCNGAYLTKVPEFSSALQGYTKVYLRYNYITEVRTSRIYQVLDVRNNPLRCGTVIPQWVVQDACKQRGKISPPAIEKEGTSYTHDESGNETTLPKTYDNTTGRDDISESVQNTPIQGAKIDEIPTIASEQNQTAEQLMHALEGVLGRVDVVTTQEESATSTEGGIVDTLQVNSVKDPTESTARDVSDSKFRILIKINGSAVLSDRNDVIGYNINAAIYISTSLVVIIMIILGVLIYIKRKLCCRRELQGDAPMETPGNITMVTGVPRMGVRMLQQCM